MQSTGQERSLSGVWRNERQARWFFAAHLQGALGTGAGYVALLLLAYEQLGLARGARPRSCSPTSHRRCCSARCWAA